jgi:AraC-like DNA-binding protein
MKLLPVVVVLVLIAIQSLLFGLFLFSNKGPKKVSNRLLGGFLFTLAIQMFAIVYEYTAEESDQILRYMCIFGYTYGPLLYLYTISLIHKEFRWQRKYYYHFAIPLVFLLSVVLGWPLCPIVGSLLYVSLIGYTYFAVDAILKYRKVVKQIQSNELQANLGWLQWTIILFSITLLLDIINRMVVDLDIVFGISIIYISLLFLVNWMFYKGLQQPKLFHGITEEQKKIATEPWHDPMAQKEMEVLLTSLLNLMNEEKPFLNPEITLSLLADQLDTTPRKLSGIINTSLNQNFASFINGYRIEMAKERLANPTDEKETVLEVMYAVGFNSKSSFNTLFKKNTGLTPSAYKKAKT